MASESLLLDPAAVAPQPWRNGRGTTRELATGPGWRVSLAELAEDGPFSSFPGFARIFTPLGDGFELVIDGVPHPARRHQPIAFPGEAGVELHRLAAPTQALNLMTERDTCRGAVRLVRATADLDPTATIRILLGAYIAEISVLPDPSPDFT